MDKKLKESANIIRSALLQLPHSGQNGFEGLIRVVLEEITQSPFRIAKAGTQGGIDGKAADAKNAIAFECKRYRSKLSDGEVKNKLFDVGSRKDIELWILCVTSDVDTQTTTLCERFTKKEHICTLILDWPKQGYSKLLATLSLAPKAVIDFFAEQPLERKKLNKIKNSLKFIGKSEELKHVGNSIRADLSNPLLGFNIAQKQNEEWFTKVFSNKAESMLALNQVVTPLTQESNTILSRDNQTTKICDFLNGPIDSGPLFVLGNEGRGKTWLIAQSWAKSENKPLLIFLSANNPIFESQFFDVTKLLAENIPYHGNRNISHWESKLERIKSGAISKTNNIIVWLDGINQKQLGDWDAIIDKISYELAQLGGKIIVTSRTHYFKDFVAQHFKGKSYKALDIPEWECNERDRILFNTGYKANLFSECTLVKLRNPRILSLATSLLSEGVVQSEQEVTIHHLLFEYMRKFTKDTSPIKQNSNKSAFFAKELSRHAEVIIERLKTEQLDDLQLFEKDIEFVADCRFFTQLGAEPTSYKLTEDGLTMAMSISLVEHLKFLKRNDKDINENLAIILEQIGAFDDMANIVLGALVISLSDSQIDQDVPFSLTEVFCRLFNVGSSLDEAFCSLAKTHTNFFLDTAEKLYLSNLYDRDISGVGNALIYASDHPVAWSQISNKIIKWLSYYTLSIEGQLHKTPSRYPIEQVEEERQQVSGKLTKRLEELTPSEQKIKSDLIEHQNSVGNLKKLALTLISGKPLTPFKMSLVNASFTGALNPNHDSSYDMLTDLVRFNRIDSLEMNRQLHQILDSLEQHGLSKTGLWMKVHLLRATGESNDSGEAEQLTDILMPEFVKHKNQTNYKERNCNSDPFDPTSPSPTNFDETYARYKTLNFNEAYAKRSNSTDEYFISETRAALIRFEPELAYECYNKLIENISSRNGESLYRGIDELKKHQPLLCKNYVLKILYKVQQEKSAVKGNYNPQKNDALLLAFPFLSALEQFDALVKMKSNSVSIQVLKMGKKLTTQQVEENFNKVLKTGNERALYNALLFIGYSGSESTNSVENHAVELIQSSSKDLRLAALLVLSDSSSEATLQRLVSSSWSAESCEKNRSNEAAYGSLALLAAAKKGLISQTDLLRRISPHYYVVAIKDLDSEVVKIIAKWLDDSIHRILNTKITSEDCGIELCDDGSKRHPLLFDVRGYAQDIQQEKGIKELFDSFDQSQDKFEKKQTQDQQKFNEFKARMMEEDCILILQSVDLQSFSKITRSLPQLAESWYSLFVKQPLNKMPSIYNLALMIANHYKEIEPQKAVELIRLTDGQSSVLNLTYAYERLDLCRIVAWEGSSSPCLDTIRVERLDKAKNDHQISLEVYAALMYGHSRLLQKYIADKISSNTPLDICRAIMVCAYSTEDNVFENTLKKYNNSKGMIGVALLAAKGEYQRNQLSKYWYEKMCNTVDNIEFWRFSNLFSELVDPRFNLWWQHCDKGSPMLDRFHLNMNTYIERKFNKWKAKREKLLFGGGIPKNIDLLIPSNLSNRNST